MRADMLGNGRVDQREAVVPVPDGESVRQCLDCLDQEVGEARGFDGRPAGPRCAGEGDEAGDADEGERALGERHCNSRHNRGDKAGDASQDGPQCCLAAAGHPILCSPTTHGPIRAVPLSRFL